MAINILLDKDTKLLSYHIKSVKSYVRATRLRLQETPRSKYLNSQLARNEFILDVLLKYKEQKVRELLWNKLPKASRTKFQTPDNYMDYLARKEEARNAPRL